MLVLATCVSHGVIWKHLHFNSLFGLLQSRFATLVFVWLPEMVGQPPCWPWNDNWLPYCFKCFIYAFAVDWERKGAIEMVANEVARKNQKKYCGSPVELIHLKVIFCSTLFINTSCAQTLVWSFVYSHFFPCIEEKCTVAVEKNNARE